MLRLLMLFLSFARLVLSYSFFNPQKTIYVTDFNDTKVDCLPKGYWPEPDPWDLHKRVVKFQDNYYNPFISSQSPGDAILWKTYLTSEIKLGITEHPECSYNRNFVNNRYPINSLPGNENTVTLLINNLSSRETFDVISALKRALMMQYFMRANIAQRQFPHILHNLPFENYTQLHFRLYREAPWKITNKAINPESLHAEFCMAKGKLLQQPSVKHLQGIPREIYDNLLKHEWIVEEGNMQVLHHDAIVETAGRNTVTLRGDHFILSRVFTESDVSLYILHRSASEKILREAANMPVLMNNIPCPPVPALPLSDDLPIQALVELMANDKELHQTTPQTCQMMTDAFELNDNYCAPPPEPSSRHTFSGDL